MGIQVRPHGEVGRVLFCLRHGTRTHIPDHEVRQLCPSVRCPLALIKVLLRAYALTGASKYVIVIFGTMVISSFVTGVWLVSIPSGTGSTQSWCLSFISESSPTQPYDYPGSISTHSEHVSSLPGRPQNGPTGHRLHLLVCAVLCLPDILDLPQSQIWWPPLPSSFLSSSSKLTTANHV